MNQPQYPNQQQVPQGYQLVQKKPWYKRPIIMIPLTLLVLLILFMGGCMALIGGAANEVDKQMNAEHTVTYKVTGSHQDALITYTNGDINTAQDNSVAGEWQKDVTIEGFSVASLTATNGIEDHGEITCQILSDGKVLNENTASGVGASASCSVGSSDIED